MTTPTCNFVPLDDQIDERGYRRWRCSICGRQTNPTPHGPDMIHASCMGRGWRNWRFWKVGDVVAMLLAYCRVTPESLKAWGFESCNCDNRRQWLNRKGLSVRRWLLAKIDRPAALAKVNAKGIMRN